LSVRTTKAKVIPVAMVAPETLEVWFLADRTNGRTYVSVASVRLSVCDVMYCG